MRVTIIVYLAAIAFLSGCAFEGVVVEKRFRPFPFYDSVGVDGIYKFELRDRAGQIHTQMVTPNVFATYEVGDYFSDLQPPPSHSPKDFKSIAPASIDMGPAPYQPVKTAGIARRAKQQHATKIAKLRHHSRHAAKTATAKRHKKHRAKVARSRRSHRHHAQA